MLRLGPLLLLALPGCKEASRARPAPAPVDWTRGGCADVETAPAFVGLTDADAAARLGAPAGQGRFRLGDGVPEFRVELLKLFPLPANADRVIEERTWRRNGCNLTLWAAERGGGWRTVHAIRWPEGTEF